MRTKLFYLSALAAILVVSGASCLQLGGEAQGPKGVFRSADKGETWTAVMALPTSKGVGSISAINVYRLFTDPSDVNAIYLGTRNQGLFYSYDNGDNWRQVSFMNGKFIYGLAVDPKNKCVIYVTDGPHIYKTIDCTRTWQLVYTEERPTERLTALAVDFGDSKIIYGTEVGGDILVSKDAGKSWRVTKRFGFELQHVVADPFIPKRIYAAAQRAGLYRSDDAGETWTALDDGLDQFSNAQVFYRLVLNPGQKNSLFWISKFGILRSDDAGATWQEVKLLTPPGSVNIYAFAINPKNQNEIYYTGTILGEKNEHVRSTFYKTTDGGASWVTKKLPTNTIPSAMLIHPEKNSVLFMGFTLLD